jgi:glycosyltransferase involved in cell wall biosynthesis
LTDVVEFTGWLNGPEVDALLRDADVALQPDLPTRMNQLSTMAKTVEYLGRGVPVVAADLIETHATVGDAGLYVPTGTPTEFAQAINTLLDDPAMRDRMRKIGQERFRDFLSWEHQASEYVAVWRRLLPVGPAPRIPAQRRPSAAPTRSDAP